MTEAIATVVETEVVENIKQSGSPLLEQARSVARSIVGGETYKIAADFMLKIKSHRKLISEKLSPPKQAAHSAWSKICALERELDTPYEAAEVEVKNGMSAYLREEEIKRRKTEAEMRAKLQKEEEDRRLETASKLEVEGKHEQAAAVIEKPIVTPPVTIAAPEKVQGESRKKVWRFKVTDDAIVPREFMVVDERKIRQAVNLYKDKTKIPGVDVWEDFEIGGRV